MPGRAARVPRSNRRVARSRSCASRKSRTPAKAGSSGQVETFNTYQTSAQPAGEHDECSVEMSLQTDKTRHYTSCMKRTEPLSISSISFAQVSFVLSTFFLKKFQLHFQFFPTSTLRVGGLTFGAPTRLFLQLPKHPAAGSLRSCQEVERKKTGAKLESTHSQGDSNAIGSARQFVYMSFTLFMFPFFCFLSVSAFFVYSFVSLFILSFF